MPPAGTESHQEKIDTMLAKFFLEQASVAYAAGDVKSFEAARTMVLLNLGFTTDKIKV